MIFDKRYLQFNNLVFDGYDMISDYSEDVSYKGSSQAYSYGHGSYMPFKSSYLYVSERSVSMTLTLHLKKIPCEYRAYYVRFAEEELGKPGKLWAIKNNEVIWANAYVTNLSPIMSLRNDVVEYDVEFVIPGGVWNKADKHRTFVLPYDVCIFMECKGYKTLNDCGIAGGGDCCSSCNEADNLINDDNCFCCCVDTITRDMVLCNHLDELQALYGCETPFQFVYDCDKADQFNTNDYQGQKICTTDGCEQNMIAGRFYSETDIPTDEVTITIVGKMKDPWITINGNTNIIKGEYDGAIVIEASGDAYYIQDGCETLLDPSVWTIPENMTYGWTIHQRNNNIIVNLNDCCQGLACVYVDHQPITI